LEHSQVDIIEHKAGRPKGIARNTIVEPRLNHPFSYFIESINIGIIKKFISCDVSLQTKKHFLFLGDNVSDSIPGTVFFKAIGLMGFTFTIWQEGS
jgi:hypothetical protein